MRRIQPPKCTVCHKFGAECESDVWPTLLICHYCQRDVMEYLIMNDCAIHGNPFAIEFALPGDNGNRPDAIRIWRRVENQSSTFREFYVRYEDDSKLPVDNSLDFLDDL